MGLSQLLQKIIFMKCFNFGLVFFTHALCYPFYFIYFYNNRKELEQTSNPAVGL